MTGNERIKIFMQLQNKNLKFQDIANKMEIKPQTLRSYLNKKGYKLTNGKYELKDGIKEDKKQIEFNEIKNTKIEKKENVKKNTTKQRKTSNPKRDKKVNLTPEDMDKLCEVYDWYLQVRDVKAIKPKTKTSKKDIAIEENNIGELKSTSIRVDKKIWEEFERLCSNSSFTKQEIITQALKNFLKENKHLL
ncbi:DNA-binding protein [Romboutsia sp. 1001713B170131_170501_G6]|uniref:DNA-binding protein n=1 Tax=Romboutsia sp. 1001713B170131_170501_G6 TaxID=2787108 RepID=UPI0018A96DF0|nr:DNA-binding protein [Romboutsia sp. 1001713B170131_170501_G6]